MEEGTEKKSLEVHFHYILKASKARVTLALNNIDKHSVCLGRLTLLCIENRTPYVLASRLSHHMLCCASQVVSFHNIRFAVE